MSIVIAVVVIALVFTYINGFHDTANSIATVVATKVLSPGQAVLLAAGTNLVGAFLGTAVAATIASGLINAGVIEMSSQLLVCALLAAIVWNLITWWLGLPSSSSHALIGSLVGAALAASGNNFDAVIWVEGSVLKGHGVVPKVVIPMVLSPLAGFIISFALMGALYALLAWFARRHGWWRRFGRTPFVNSFFGKAQIASAAYMGFAHGHNDAQKTMGIIAMTLIGAEATGALNDLPSWLAFMHPDAHAGDGIAMWIVLTCAVVMAAGTASGGWKIIKTLGHKMVKLHPIHGFAAETSSATVLTVAAHFGMPVSTTHSISTAIMGVGFAKNPRSLRLGVIERIVWAWILTIPAAGGCAYLILKLFELFGWA